MTLRPRSLPRRARFSVRVLGTHEPVGRGDLGPGGESSARVEHDDEPDSQLVDAMTVVADVLPPLVWDRAVVGVLIDGRPASLDTPILSDAALVPLSLADEEGREIYRRSVGLMLIEAARIIAPHSRFWLNSSFGAFQVACLDAASGLDAATLVERFREVTGDLRAASLPFREEVWSVDEARDLFSDDDGTDAVSLLRTWREATVVMVSCGDSFTLSHGPMLRSTASIGALGFDVHPQGLLVELCDLRTRHASVSRGVDARQSEIVTPRFGGDMEVEHRRWLEGAGLTSVGAFNESCIGGKVSAIVRMAESFHEKRISLMASEIAYRRGKARVVCVAGPSSSGKSSFLRRLAGQLELVGVRAVTLSLDDYQADTPPDVEADAKAAIHADLEANVGANVAANVANETRRGRRADKLDKLDTIDSLDVPLLREHVRRLLRGGPVITAKYDFLGGRSHPDGGRMLQLGPSDALLIEGVHGLDPELLTDELGMDRTFKIFLHVGTTLALDRASPVSPSDVRLLRRIVRDRRLRGHRVADILAHWPAIQRAEAQQSYPCLPIADAVFDTSLVYELSVLKIFAERYLLEVPATDAAYPMAFRLRRLVDRFVTIYPEHVAPSSILREFIGGPEG